MAYRVRTSGGNVRVVSKKPNYQVLWEWRDPEMFGASYQTFAEVVDATNAERAIAKARKIIHEENEVDRKSEVIILEVRKLK